MVRALITGITGQDGGYLAEQLLTSGVEVVGVVRRQDNLVGELLDRSPGVVIHYGDLQDPPRLSALIDDIEPDEIYNLGGLSSVAQSWQEPLLTADINGLGAAAVLEGAWKLQERLGRQVRVLQASSAEIFGIPDDVPQTESTPLRPLSPYGASKAFAHHLVCVYRTRGLHACACILYNHESPRRPVAFVTRKITKAAAMIATGEQETIILGNLDVRRDWGWAPDYVRAIVAAVRHAEPDDYVVATGQAHSVRDFVEAAFTYAGVDDWAERIRIDDSFARASDAPEQIGDSRKARVVLGWAPTVSFAELVARMVDEDLPSGGLS